LHLLGCLFLSVLSKPATSFSTICYTLFLLSSSCLRR
jgi:hypothetical protein